MNISRFRSAGSTTPTSRPTVPTRIWTQLNREGIEVARCSVERLMCEMGIQGARRGRKVFTTISAGSRGDSYDNALAESVIGLFKTESICNKGRWSSLDDVEFGSLEWVAWWNNRRLLEPIGVIPPVAAEARTTVNKCRSPGPGLKKRVSMKPAAVQRTSPPFITLFAIPHRRKVTLPLLPATP